MTMWKTNDIHLFTWLAIVTLFFVSLPAMAQTESDAPAASLVEAFTKLGTELDRSDRPFLAPQDRLLFYADVTGVAQSPLAALLQRDGRRALVQSGRFKQVMTPADVPFPILSLNEETLDRLDRLGIACVLDVSATVTGGRLLLRARSIWLEGRSWAAMLQDPPLFPEERTRIEVKESAQWSILAQSADEIQPSHIAWRMDTVATSSGRALDLTVTDLDNDRQADVALLFEDRVEIWLQEENHFVFRHAFALDSLDLRLRSARYVTGSMAACRMEGEARPQIYLSRNNMASGQIFQWNGRKLVHRGEFLGVPLGCTKSGAALGQYEAGQARFSPEINISKIGEGVMHGRTVAAPFVSAAFLPNGNYLLVGERGNVTAHGIPLGSAALQCGQHPALLDGSPSPLLACSLAEVQPARDRVIIWRLTADGAEEESEQEKQPGEIVGLDGQRSLAGDLIFSARYVQGSDKTYIDRYRR